VSSPRPDSDDVARIEALRAELRRLLGEVLRLEEDNRVLRERIAFLVRELEQTRRTSRAAYRPRRTRCGAGI